MNVIPFPGKLRMVTHPKIKRLMDSIGAIESLDSFGYPTENNLRPDGTQIVTTLETRDREGA